MVRSGKVVPGRVARLRFSYDEHIDDSMYAGHAERLMRCLVEDPEENGCELSLVLAQDGFERSCAAVGASVEPPSSRV